VGRPGFRVWDLADLLTPARPFLSPIPRSSKRHKTLIERDAIDDLESAVGSGLRPDRGAASPRGSISRNRRKGFVQGLKLRPTNPRPIAFDGNKDKCRSFDFAQDDKLRMKITVGLTRAPCSLRQARKPQEYGCRSL
jgi:hypothetical protein